MGCYSVGVIKAELDPYHNTVYTYDTQVQIAIEELCKVTKKDHYGVSRDSLAREGDTICMYGHYWRLERENLRPSVLATDRKDGKAHTELTMPCQVYNVNEL